MSQFTFDVKLFATFTIEAETEAEARAYLHAHADVMDCNGGAWPTGHPILFEASIDGQPDLVED